ncbi:WAT1-related protein At3g56620-like isoform X1 [Rosa rugosa]|uniref:WAT1-related protein At3g56620-like isoform X1 n=1 Tax=Rosa rugosa TaxID=74645 RepID=UPI002B411599|nr:WAT1-related protein At3g56620-like isoform X1 [Rosa rugosa]
MKGSEVGNSWKQYAKSNADGRARRESEIKEAVGGIQLLKSRNPTSSIFSNVCFAGYTIVSKVALDKGMNRYVFVVYGHAFGTLATALFAFLFERGVLGRTLYYMGLEYTSPTFASAMGNMIPSITFILAVLCNMMCSGWNSLIFPSLAPKPRLGELLQTLLVPQS